ncbi:DNA-3-methyladenine glycosylase [Cocos nucifera]|uniref:DNA-3-methyladenine glycosylase n=1 Tax=Cocos nucifera TaxID=13894 RepID=A0A8K0MUX3_COCNU|nr:DNA-3-methyladenine glycosylase [Cocos nucifera]
MPTPSLGRHVLERSPSPGQVERRVQSKSSLSKHLQRVYPLSIQRSSSSLTLSSLSLSQNSNDSSLNSSISSWDRKIQLSFHGMFSSWERRFICAAGKGRFGCGELGGFGSGEFESFASTEDLADDVAKEGSACGESGNLKRCNWITKSSDEVYVTFHDECWGVPAYNDKEAFAKFDHDVVAKMEEKDIMEISSNKELMLAECRVAKEFGSFSGYIWGHVNHKPMINKYKHPRSVPFRTPKSEAISKDLVLRNETNHAGMGDGVSIMMVTVKFPKLDPRPFTA